MEMDLQSYKCLGCEDSRIGLVSAKETNIEFVVSPSYYNIFDTFNETDFF